MYCCPHCFNDNVLKAYLKEWGSSGTCDYCGSKSKYCLEAYKLKELFEPVVNLYSIHDDFMPLEELKKADGQFIWEKLQEDWDIFNDLDFSKQKSLTEAIFDEGTGKDRPQFLNSFVKREVEYWGTLDEPSDNLKKQWEELRLELTYKNRFFPKKAFNIEQLSDVITSFTDTIDSGDIFYRARISVDDQLISTNKMGKPPATKSQDGRANPKGIPYLYLASDIETAIAEVRPNIEDSITLARFKFERPLTVVDLRHPSIESPFRFPVFLEEALTYLGFLRILGIELSKPVNLRNSGLEYIPLQYLCELIKHSGYGGVMYKSAVSNGYNLALFNETHCGPIHTELVKVKTIKYKHRRVKPHA